MQAQELAKTIDHTLLRPDTISAEVERLCCEATTYHFAAVCVFPHFVPLAAELLNTADVKVCTVVSFPFGADAPRAKVVACEAAVSQGAVRSPTARTTLTATWSARIWQRRTTNTFSPSGWIWTWMDHCPIAPSS